MCQLWEGKQTRPVHTHKFTQSNHFNQLPIPHDSDDFLKMAFTHNYHYYRTWMNGFVWKWRGGRYTYFLTTCAYHHHYHVAPVPHEITRCMGSSARNEHIFYIWLSVKQVLFTFFTLFFISFSGSFFCFFIHPIFFLERLSIFVYLSQEREGEREKAEERKKRESSLCTLCMVHECIPVAHFLFKQISPFSHLSIYSSSSPFCTSHTHIQYHHTIMYKHGMEMEFTHDIMYECFREDKIENEVIIGILLWLLSPFVGIVLSLSLCMLCFIMCINMYTFFTKNYYHHCEGHACNAHVQCSFCREKREWAGDGKWHCVIPFGWGKVEGIFFSGGRGRYGAGDTYIYYFLSPQRTQFRMRKKARACSIPSLPLWWPYRLYWSVFSSAWNCPGTYVRTLYFMSAFVWYVGLGHRPVFIFIIVGIPINCMSSASLFMLNQADI